MRKLRVLFIGAAIDMSISDSARGYLGALRRQGHSVYYFNTVARIAFNAMGLRNGPHPELASDFALTSRLASEGMVVEALRQRSELVVISSGLALHPDGLELLARAGFATALILTESPYDDDRQVVFARHAGHVFTNDRWSATAHGWSYLASAWDPEFHHPYPAEAAEDCDVLFVGTGWPERQKLLEGVDWNGIRLRILGLWPELKQDSPLWPAYDEIMVTNDETARLYSSARIAVNHHRGHPKAESLNPRGYELGGCGVLQISDWRPELRDVYHGMVPVYRDSAELERLVRLHLSDDTRRLALAERQRATLLAGRHTFDDRAAQMMEVLFS